MSTAPPLWTKAQQRFCCLGRPVSCSRSVLLWQRSIFSGVVIDKWCFVKLSFWPWKIFEEERKIKRCNTFKHVFVLGKVEPKLRPYPVSTSMCRLAVSQSSTDPRLFWHFDSSQSEKKKLVSPLGSLVFHLVFGNPVHYGKHLTLCLSWTRLQGETLTSLSPLKVKCVLLFLYVLEPELMLKGAGFWGSAPGLVHQSWSFERLVTWWPQP